MTSLTKAPLEDRLVHYTDGHGMILQSLELFQPMHLERALMDVRWYVRYRANELRQSLGLQMPAQTPAVAAAHRMEAERRFMEGLALALNGERR